MSLQQRYLDFLQRKPSKPEEHAFWFILKALAHVYQTLWSIRRLAYRIRMFPRRRLPCPVVSVGNITTGGTGKTPIVIHLANHFISKGMRVVVLTRGYGGRGGRVKPLWVSNGEKILSGPVQAGDEPVLIAKKAPKAAVVVCPDRHRSGLEAVLRFKPDLIILDDGFQRRYSIHRDLDLLVVDGLQPFSTGRVLPAGLLREPLEALRDAGVFIINKANLARSLEDIKTVLARRNPRAPVIESIYRPIALKDLATGKEVATSRLENLPVGALCGIGNPQAFVRTLEQFHVVVRHVYPLDDHFSYRVPSLMRIVADARRRGLLYLVTTEKDEVKLPRGFGEQIPVLVLSIEWTVTGGESHWKCLLKGLELSEGRP